MKLVHLLTSIVVLWCLLGTVVLGPGILIYPLGWCAVLGVMFSVHKFLGLGKMEARTSVDPSSKPSEGSQPGNHDAALAP